MSIDDIIPQVETDRACLPPAPTSVGKAYRSFEKCRTLQFDPDDPVHVAELYRQRILCRWSSAKKYIDEWRRQTRNGEKLFFWVFLPELEQEAFELRAEPEMINMQAIVGPPPPSRNFQPIGHFALDWVDYDGDVSLASFFDKRITFATFFLLISQTGRGLGNAVMDLAEDLAVEVGAHTITLNTLDGVEATSAKFWARIGCVFDPTARVNETWYLKRGYIPYKRLHRYPETDVFTGEAILMKGVFMSKDLVAKG